jgi:hypothetical protein
MSLYMTVSASSSIVLLQVYNATQKYINFIVSELHHIFIEYFCFSIKKSFMQLFGKNPRPRFLYNL